MIKKKKIKGFIWYYMKRLDYTDWDTTFIGIAILISYRSKDPSTQHGAVIVNPDNRIISVGYNGFPTACSDDDFSWEATEKQDFVIHAEQNAIYNAPGKNLSGCRLYLFSEKGYYPCTECAKGIIQTGIKEVVIAYYSGLTKYKPQSTMKMFNAAKVSIRIIDSCTTKISTLCEKLSVTKNKIEEMRNDEKVSFVNCSCMDN
jgi:dCMP deaminase